MTSLALNIIFLTFGAFKVRIAPDAAGAVVAFFARLAAAVRRVGGTGGVGGRVAVVAMMIAAGLEQIGERFQNLGVLLRLPATLSRAVDKRFEMILLITVPFSSLE